MSPLPHELREAAGLAPALAQVGDKDLFKTPVFTYDFKSPGFPELDGEVVVRFATVGDLLEIEALAAGRGRFGEAIATLQVLISKAPPSWYVAPEGVEKPILALNRIPDGEALVDLYRQYSVWRDSFRRGPKS